MFAEYLSRLVTLSHSIYFEQRYLHMTHSFPPYGQQTNCWGAALLTMIVYESSENL